MPKVLVATVKPFAPAAVDQIREIIENAGYKFELIEKYGSQDDLVNAVSDADAMIIRSDKVDSDCGNVAVAGGLNSTPMVLETIMEGQTSRIDVLSFVSPLSVVVPEPDHINVYSSSSPSGVALQPAVAKYVLNASFLI